MKNSATDMHFGASKKIFRYAEALRNKMTAAEEKLWNELSNKKVDGFKFRRQHPLYIFIADFYCHQKKLVIEIDGGIHSLSDHKEYDIGRTEELEQFGIKVIRFSNEDVLHNTPLVLQKIKEELLSLAPDP